LSKLLLLNAGGLGLEEAAGVPLVVSPRFPEPYDLVVVKGSIVGEGVSIGSLIAYQGLGGERVVRRASGGGIFRSSGGDHYILIIYREGTLKAVHDIIREEFNSLENTVIGIGKSSGRPFTEIYTSLKPERILESFSEWDVDEEDDFPRELLKPVLNKLLEEKWTDLLKPCGDGFITYRSIKGDYYFGLVGCIEDGLIRSIWPDSNIHVYPPGLARSIIKEAVLSPPSLTLGYSLANSFVSLVEYAGIGAEEIFSASKGFMVKAESFG